MKIQLSKYISLAAALILVVGCAGSSRSTSTRNSSGEVQASENTAGRIDASAPTHWDYDTMPTPAPSRKPNRRLNEIAFQDNSTTVDSEGIAVCRTIAAEVKSGNPRLLVVGFSHKTEKDLGLGLRRADAVRDRLVAEGLVSSRIEVASFGSQFSGIANSPRPYMVTAAQGVEIWTLHD